MTRVAVTADVHLRSREEHPERLNALRDVMEKTRALDVGALIIAGDLFDEDYQDYAQFEALCRDFTDLGLHIIPGNHDPGLESRHIVAENVTVYDEPVVAELGTGRFLFLPFREGTTMGEVMAEAASEAGPEPWILVGHGDYLGGTRRPNPLEPGVYMPLMRADLQRFQPRLVLLGHIHDPPAHDTVRYPGSPCGLDITETGRRRFLTLDTHTWQLSGHPVNTDVLFFRERFVLVPHEEEVARLSAEIRDRIRGWNIAEKEKRNARVRVEASGYVRDRSAVAAVLSREFSDFAFYKGEGPKLDELAVSADTQLGAIAEKVRASIQELPFDWGENEPTKEDVLRSALQEIYSEK